MGGVLSLTFHNLNLLTLDYSLKHCTRIYPNIVNSKSTQFLVARKIDDEERRFIEDAVAEGSKKENAPSWQGVSVLKRHLMGISQPIESMGFTDEDVLILKGGGQMK